MPNIFILFIVLFLLAVEARAQVEARKYSNDFLTIGVGARAAGMGNAMTAAASDVTAAYWNPAGLMRSAEKIDVGLMHAEYFAGIAKYDYGGISYAVDSSRRVGFSLIRFGVDNINNTLNFRDGQSFDYSKITQFSIADYAFLFSYAQKAPFLPGLTLGGNAKLVYRTIGPFADAWGFGFDLGAQYQRKNLQIGAAFHDLSGTFNAWFFNADYNETFVKNNQEIPQNSVEVTLPSGKLGVSYLFLRQKKFNILASYDMQLYFDGKRQTPLSLGAMSVEPRMGVEVGYKQLVFIRMGASNLVTKPDDEGVKRLGLFPTAGIGLKWKGISLDYALANFTGLGTSLYSNLISLRYAFNGFKFAKAG